MWWHGKRRERERQDLQAKGVTRDKVRMCGRAHYVLMVDHYHWFSVFGEDCMKPKYKYALEMLWV